MTRDDYDMGYAEGFHDGLSTPRGSAEDDRAVQGDDGTGEEIACQQCGARNPVWWAAHPAWNLAVGGDPTREAGGILCPSCFHQKWLAATVTPGGTR